MRRLLLRKRAVFLIEFGLLYLLVGANVLLSDVDRFRNIPFVGVVLDHQAWGALWIAAGAVAITIAAVRSWRDAPAFVALLIPSGLWTLFYIASTAYWLAGVGGRGTAMGGVLAYAFIWSVVMLIAGWPNPPVVVEPEPIPEHPEAT